MAEFSRFHQVALGDQLQPVGNVVVYRTLPFTVGVTAGETAVRLVSCLFRIKGIINLNKLTGAALHIALWRVYSLNIEKLKLVI